MVLAQLLGNKPLSFSSFASKGTKEILNKCGLSWVENLVNN